jgi:hypothetical protein
MSSHEPAPGDADTAQTASRNHVVVTGAGFSRALVPGAPLLVDDFSNDSLEDKVRGLPDASRLLDWERSLHPSGYIDIERLMTRLDALMPYDYAESAGNAANEYAFLLSELRRAFLGRLHEARKGEVHREELERFARYCEAKGCCCITFNYDDFLDEALAQTGSWNPYCGFFCLSSLDTVASFDELETHSILRLLKLHGSINWRPKLGYASPVAIDSITHHHEWAGISLRNPQVGSHLEPEPVMVPPVLSKSSLVEQPVLRLVWSQAFDSLATAHEVTFIGYSFPTTDMAARTLFSEALKDLPREDINVVNLSREDSEAEATRRRYRSVLGEIPDNRFHFDGALEWIKGLSW